MSCYAIYPKDVYLILPYNDDGSVAGVYVGASVYVKERINSHIYDYRDNCGKQKEMHDLMRKNGFVYATVDKIDDWQYSYIEYDWLDYFKKNHSYRIFNSLEYGGARADFNKIPFLEKKLNQARFKFQASRIEM